MADETPAETTVTAAPAPEENPDVAALKKALAAERSANKDNAHGRKVAEQELERQRTAQLSDTERAVVEAKAAGRSEALLEAGKRLAAAEFRAAAATAGLDVGEVLDLVDTARFVTADGEPDDKAITAAVEKFTALRGEQKPAHVEMDLGPRAATVALNGDPLLDSLKTKLHIR